MTNISPKFFAKLLMDFQHSFHHIDVFPYLRKFFIVERLTIGCVISPSHVFRVKRKAIPGD